MRDVLAIVGRDLLQALPVDADLPDPPGLFLLARFGEQDAIAVEVQVGINEGVAVFGA